LLSELARWLPALALALGREGQWGRLRELLQELQGPPGGEGAGCGWQPRLAGLDKRRLLAQALAGLAGLPSQPAQRLTAEFADLAQLEEAGAAGSVSGLEGAYGVRALYPYLPHATDPWGGEYPPGGYANGGSYAWLTCGAALALAWGGDAWKQSLQQTPGLVALLCESSSPPRLLPPYGALLRSWIARDGTTAISAEGDGLEESVVRNLSALHAFSEEVTSTWLSVPR
jgi:hypothetical protein